MKRVYVEVKLVFDSDSYDEARVNQIVSESDYSFSAPEIVDTEVVETDFDKPFTVTVALDLNRDYPGNKVDEIVADMDYSWVADEVVDTEVLGYSDTL